MEGQFREPFEQFGDVASFPVELGGIGKVLILAAAAVTKKRAKRFDAVGRRGDDGDEIGLGVVWGIPIDPGANGFTWQGEGDEHDPAILSPTHAVAEIAERIDNNLDLFVPGEGMRLKSARGRLRR